jgi:hypothetical protein
LIGEQVHIFLHVIVIHHLIDELIQLLLFYILLPLPLPLLLLHHHTFIV